MLLVVGRIGRPTGSAARSSVEVRTDDPDTRSPPGTTSPPTARAAGPADRRAHAAGTPAACSCASPAIGDRDAAEALRGTCSSSTPPTSRRPTDPDEFHDQRADRPHRRDHGRRRASARSPTSLHHGQDLLVVARRAAARRAPLVPFVRGDRPRGRRARAAGSSSTRRPGLLGGSDETRHRHDLPRVLRPARRLPARQGPASAASSTSTCTTCATGPTTGTAPSTTPRTAAAPAW